MNTRRKAPMWQRNICALLCLAGTIVLGMHIYHDHAHAAALISKNFLLILGTVLFGYIAATGQLPGSRP